MTNDVEILLIEDNLQEAQMTIRSLKKNNLANHLLHIDDSEEALDFLFARNKYSDRVVGSGLKLILLDLKLPKVDGHEILSALKQDERTKFIPVIVLTSSKEESDIFKSYQFGVNSYIVKPVNFDSFSKAVVELGMYWMLLNVPPVKKSI